jgi:hypothetical protein
VIVENYSWAVKGFGGLVTMLEEMSEAQRPMDDNVLRELEVMLAKLKRVIDIQRRLLSH